MIIGFLCPGESVAEDMAVAERAPSVSREFSIASFVWRLLGSLLLVLATYNPTEVSYAHWVLESRSDGGLGPEHFVIGVLLMIGWAILLLATQRSLGRLGLVLGAALLGGIVWLLADAGILSVDSAPALTWVSLVCLAVLLAIGLSWSHIWRRLTGQYEVDDTG